MNEKRYADCRVCVCRFVSAVLALILLLSLASCSEQTPTDPNVSVPTVLLERREISEDAEGIVLYTATAQAPRLLLPAGSEELAAQTNRVITRYLDQLLACPVDLSLLLSRAESDRAHFTPYEREIFAEVTRVDERFLSVQFTVESRGNGTGSTWENAGFTVRIGEDGVLSATELLGISQEEGRRLFCAAFEADMQKSPQYYDLPEEGVSEELVDLTCICLTDSGIRIWMPDATVSLGASPVLTLQQEDILRFIGTGTLP